MPSPARSLAIPCTPTRQRIIARRSQPIPPDLVQVLVLPETAPLGLVTLLESLELAAGGQAKPLLRLLTMDGRPVRLRSGLTIHADASIGSAGPAALIILCDMAIGPIEAAEGRADTRAWLQEKERSGTMLAAIGGGVVPLAEAGVLDGRTVAVAPSLIPLLQERFPLVRFTADVPFTREPGLLSAGVPAGCADLIVELVLRLYGKEEALLRQAEIRDLVRSNQRPSRAADVATPSISDEAVLAARYWMATNLGTDISLCDVARHVGMSERNLTRRFQQALGQSPTFHLHSMRVETAQGILKNSSRSIADVAQQVGYRNLSSFLRIFKKHTASTPGAYRKGKR